MNFIVTGGAGFIGSHLVEYLLENKAESVTVIDNFSTGNVSNLNLNSQKINLVKQDISDSLLEISWQKTQYDAIFHLAALADIVPSIRNPENYMKVNVQGTVNVMQLARHLNVKRVVYAASSSCYGIPESFPTDEEASIRPSYPYALSKNLGEQVFFHWLELYGLVGLSLRLFNVYGPRARTSGNYGAVLGVFLAQKAAGLPLTVVGDGNQVRDFTYVRDVAKAFYLAYQSNFSGLAINIGTGKPRSVRDLVKILKSEYVNIPKRPGEPDRTESSTKRATELLNWHAEIDLEEGLNETMKSIQDWEKAPIWTPEKIEGETQDWFKYLGPKK